jgi:putative Ca2+/H+ antiporter (TMEM165/GDT1 family)
MFAFWKAFILIIAAEMGDKTQLATAVMAAEAAALLPVWLGSCGGMVVADYCAVVVGAVMGKRIPARR